MSLNLAAIKQKAKVLLLAAGGFIVSVSNSAIDYYQTQTAELPQIVEEAEHTVSQKASDFQDSVDQHIQKGVEAAKERLKPVKKAVKKTAKKVDDWGCKIGSKKDPRCLPKIYPLVQEEKDSLNEH